MSKLWSAVKWPPWRRVFAVFVGLCLLHLLIEQWWLQRIESSLAQRVIQQQQDALMRWYDQRQGSQQGAEKVLQYVAENILAQYRLAQSFESWIEGIDRDLMMALLAGRDTFQQLRLLDKNGQELRRFDFDEGRVKQVPPYRLQNKSHRYYVDSIKSLPAFRSAVVDSNDPVFYWSPLDLNVENGEIERPILPIQCLAIRLANDAGEPIGMLLVNVLADQLGEPIWRLLSTNADKAGLLDNDGYWLLNTGQEPSWGRQLGIPQSESTMAEGDAELWQWISLHTGLQSRRDLAGNIVTSLHIEHDGHQEVVSSDPAFLFVSLSQASLKRLLAKQSANFSLFRVWALLGYFLLSCVISSMTVLYGGYLKLLQRSSRQQRVMGSFQKLQADIPVPMLLINSSLEIMACNLAACRLFGYSQRDLENMTCSQLMPGDEGDVHEAIMRGFFGDHSDSRKVLHQRVECFTSGRLRRSVEMNISRVVENDVVTLLVTLIDLQPQLSTEQKLATTLDNLNLSVQLAGLGVFSQRERDGALLMDNVMARHLDLEPHAKQMFSLPFNQFLKHINPFDRETVEHRFDELWRIGGKIQFIMHTELNKVPSKVLSVVITMTYSKDGELVGLQGVVMDVTEYVHNELRVKQLSEDLEQEVQERTRQLETAVSELESFSYTVSHDLRSPLRAINGFASLLERSGASQLDDKNKAFLESIKQGAVVMGDLIDDLLMLSRVSRKSITMEICNLSLIAQSILSRLQMENPERRLVSHIEPSVLVLADAGLMRVLLTNLLENAWKFTVDRNVTRIELKTEIVDGQRCVVVADNGIGIAPQHLKNIFQPFQRQCDTSKFSGSGIGLATAKRILDVHDGDIWAQSVVGEGTRIYILVGSFRHTS